MTNDLLSTGAADAQHPMSFLLDQELNLPKAGEIRTGTIIERYSNAILVDIGAKSEGIITGKELDILDEDTLEELAVGNEVKVYIVNPEDKDGNVILSYAKAAEEKDWQRAADLLESQEVYESKVVGYNRGGILVKVGQVRGFIPNSQLRRERFHGSDDNDTVHKKMVGQPILTKVIEVNRSRNRLILSERAAEKEMREAKRGAILAKLNEGDVVEGRVVNLANFGAFVNIGGVEGLVHLSELSWKRVNDPSEILQVGDEIKVYVLNIDEEKQRLALSLKQLEPDPWTLIDEIYRVGQLTEATITKLTKFGAFARLNDDYELEGLIHISELSEDRVEHPREVLKPGDVVTIRIIRIDSEQRQLGLSLKQVASADFIEADLEALSN